MKLPCDQLPAAATARAGATMRLLVFFAVAAAALASGCGGGHSGSQVRLSDADRALLSRLGPLPAVPASPTNAHADDANAATLGQWIFFDKRMSGDGTVACVSCHDPKHGFADTKPFSVGSFGGTGVRHASTLVNAAYDSFQFWDGRADSLWAQPLQAIENPVEGDFSRCEVVHFLALNYGPWYSAAFGPMPDVSAVPPKCPTTGPVWAGMPAAQQELVNRIFTNLGKAIEAHVRRIVSRNSPLDRYLQGDSSALSDAALRGAHVFVAPDRGNCIACHDGPNLTDNSFHVLGIPQPNGPLDEGRFTGVEKLLADPFNGDGAFSDAPGGRLAGLYPRPTMVGQFKTPSLREVLLRPPYGHLGSFATIEDFIDFHDRGGGDPTVDRYAGVKEKLVAPISLTAQEKADLISFLGALQGDPMPLEVLGPPE